MGTSDERAELERRLRSLKIRAEDARRARVILMLADGASYSTIEATAILCAGSRSKKDVVGRGMSEENRSTTTVRAAGLGEQDTVIGVITLAFSTDPMTRWTFPDPATYLAVMPDLARAFGGRSFAHGTADLVEGGFAAAMWLPPGVDPDSERLVALAGQHAPRDRSADLMQVFEQMDAFHPADPCWYLPLIGVDPTYQGRGCGSALLKYALARCDRDGVAAYLESSNPRNIPLYLRHGFETIGSIQAGSSPTVVPMLRRPR